MDINIAQFEIKQEKDDYFSDEDNVNRCGLNDVIKSEIEQNYVCKIEDVNVKVEDQIIEETNESNEIENVDENFIEHNSHMLAKMRLPESQLYSSSNTTNTDTEATVIKRNHNAHFNPKAVKAKIIQNVAVVLQNNDEDNGCGYLKCTECSFETTLVKHFNDHLRMQHNQSVEIFQCQHCSYNTKSKAYLIRHFQRKHEHTLIYNCEMCEYETMYKTELRRHYQQKHDQSNYMCGHCRYVTKIKQCLNRHIKMKHCDQTVAQKCPYCQYKTKWNQCLQRHISVVHIAKQNKKFQDVVKLAALHVGEVEEVPSDTPQADEQIICKIEPKVEIFEHDLIPQSHVCANINTENVCTPTIVKTFKHGVCEGVAATYNNNAGGNNLLRGNCTFTVPVLINTSNVPQTIILLNPMNIVQTPNNNIINGHANSHVISQNNHIKIASQENDETKQMNATVITECGDFKSFRCEFCGYTTGSKAYLSRHRKTEHAETVRATLTCEYCSYKSNCRAELTRHFKLKHDTNSEVFECAFCPFKTKYKPEFNRHYKLKHDESSLSFVCGFCSYSTKRRHSLIRHIKMKHSEDTESLRCKECDYTTKWKQSLKTHVKLKHSRNSQSNEIKGEIKLE